VIVDVLSFTTCVAVAAERGARVIPCRWKDARAGELAAERGAALAGPRASGGYSLSPRSLTALPAGARLVLPSPNGSTLALAAAVRGTVLAGALRNRTAVARRAATAGGPVAVIAAGERWADHTLRPCLEDLIGAGALIARLPGTRSAEAAAAERLFAAAEGALEALLLECSSGRELLARGFAEDVAMAAALDVSEAAPELRDGEFL
jgi:2-phosphosulfolactate phosphatase